MAPKLDIVVSNSADEIGTLLAQGFCAVECSIGGSSIVDVLNMDHHGDLSHLEAVSMRSYRDHFGARRDDPRFVIAGQSDADAAFTVAGLAGLLPHPSRVDEFASAPPPVKTSMTKDLSTLAETVAIIDTDPIGRDLSSMPSGDLLLAWNALSGTGRDSLSAIGGVALWMALTTGRADQLAPYLAAGVNSETTRRQAARADLDERGQTIAGVLVLRESQTWGFDVWYGRKTDASADSPEGWTHPVAVAWVADAHNVTIGCPNTAVAEVLFGPGGLKTVFSYLEPQGWGGREAVGGSPRGEVLTWEQVEVAARTIASLIKTPANVS